MDFWEDPEKVASYISMAEGYDGRALVSRLLRHLAPGSTVLELGMGPGVDLAILAEHYLPTGSDRSSVFVQRHREAHPEADVLRLDAVTLETDRVFEGLFSNKVLQHLTREEMRQSLARQVSLLEPGGIAMHALWYGDGATEEHGLLFTRYTASSLKALLPAQLEVVETSVYEEMEPADSMVAILRRRSGRRA